MIQGRARRFPGYPGAWLLSASLPIFARTSRTRIPRALPVVGGACPACGICRRRSPELERNLIGERTALALRHKASQGQHVGRPPRGARIEDKQLVADDEALRFFCRARALRQSGLTYAQVGRALEAEGFVPIRGRRLWPSTVYSLVNNPNLARIAGEAA